MISLTPHIAKSQQWQTVMSIDSRIGYASNSYLNPYLSEWNSATESGYGLISLTSQSYWYKNDNSLGITGGIVYEPLFSSNTEAWKGGLGLVSYNYRPSESLRLGAQGGVTYFSSSFSRFSTWLQPTLSWFISSYTSLKIRAGTHFRTYNNYPDSTDSRHRFDPFAIEFETWPSYNLSISAGLYGGLDRLASLQEGFSSHVITQYIFNNGASASLNIGLEQYQVSTTTEIPSGGGPSGVPAPGSDTETIKETDRIFRTGLSGVYPLDSRFSLFGTVDYLGLRSESSNFSTGDFQVSAGVRFSFNPKLNRDNRGIEPEWNANNNTYSLRIRYPGGGQLYLIGDFNNWNRPGIPMVRQEGNTYVADIELSTGAYAYKVLRVLGGTESWLEFSDNTYTVEDGFGDENALLLVE